MKFPKFSIPFISFILLINLVLSCKKAEETKQEPGRVLQTENGVDYGSLTLEADDFASGIKKSDAVVIDLGFPADFEQGHIEGAININFFDQGFQEKVLLLDKTKKYYLYSKSDPSAKRTAAFMKQNGFNDVYILNGGIEAWKEYEKK